MREFVIAGNWKMNTIPEDGISLTESLKKLTAKIDRTGVVICPPFTHLAQIAKVLAGTKIGLGAQNVHWDNFGAFTGEISGTMLRKIGCEWVIIGHSERRTYFGETDKNVNRRLLKALELGLRPIMCIGESLDERESGKTFKVLEKQIENGLKDVKSAGFGGFVIAYEPVWAIGTGKTATPEQAQEAHNFIREKLARLFSRSAADETIIQYGGSMNDKNANELLSMPDVDGGLIGGASLKAEKFFAIIEAAEQLSQGS